MNKRRTRIKRKIFKDWQSSITRPHQNHLKNQSISIIIIEGGKITTDRIGKEVTVTIAITITIIREPDKNIASPISKIPVTTSRVPTHSQTRIASLIKSKHIMISLEIH